MRSSPPTIQAPAVPTQGVIYLDDWNKARTPEKLREAVRVNLDTEVLARFILGSDSPTGNTIRKLLLQVKDPQAPMPEPAANLLRAVHSNSREVWGHLLGAAAAYCSDPRQAWRLFAAWSYTTPAKDYMASFMQTTSYRLPESLDTSGLTTKNFNEAWMARNTMRAGLNETRWIFLLGAMKDPRLLDRQRQQSSDAARASAAWTALFNNEYDPQHAARLLEECDLMEDAHYRTFLPTLCQSLQQDLDNVPTDELYELGKAIRRLGNALDRHIQISGNLPRSVLGQLGELIVSKGAEPGQRPHLEAWVRRNDLNVVSQERGFRTGPGRRM